MNTRPTIRDPRLLRSLQYFEAVARRGSVALAAEEMGVSSSAVSHQLRELSGMLGEDLVEKSGRGVVLTPPGRRLANRLEATFSDLDNLVTEVVGQPVQRLRLAVCSSFGPAWLAPRLPALARAHPEIDVELRLYSHDPEQTHAVADAIVTAHPVKAGYQSITLFEEMLVAVRKPSGEAGHPAGVPKLITTDPEDDQLGLDWLAYWERTGIPRGHVAAAEVVRCTHYLLAIELAKAGVGVALVPDFLAAEPLAAGTLVRLDLTRLPSGRVYRLCHKEARNGDPVIQGFARWMKAEIRHEAPVATEREARLA